LAAFGLCSAHRDQHLIALVDEPKPQFLSFSGCTGGANHDHFFELRGRRITREIECDDADGGECAGREAADERWHGVGEEEGDATGERAEASSEVAAFWEKVGTFMLESDKKDRDAE
jgi:hypothetical protein